MVVCLPFSPAVKSWEKFLLLLGYLCSPGSTVLSNKEIANTEIQWKQEKNKDKNTSQKLTCLFCANPRHEDAWLLSLQAPWGSL